MKDTLVAEIRSNLAFQRLEVGENVSVGDDYAERLGSRARGEDDLNDVVARERRRRDSYVGVRRYSLAQTFQMHRRSSGDLVIRRADTQSGIHLLSDSLCEVWGRNLVDGNDDRAAQQASEEDNHPFGAVLTPEEYLVALRDLTRLQLVGETVRVGQHLAVRPALQAIAAMMNIRNFPCVPLEVVEVLEYGGARHLEQFNCSSEWQERTTQRKENHTSRLRWREFVMLRSRAAVCLAPG